MSQITNGGLTRSGRMLHSKVYSTHMATVDVKGLEHCDVR